MGLFDKIRNVVNTAVSSVQSANDPLSDVIIKNYFEIICGMRSTFLSSGAEPVTGNTKAKRYVEYFTGEPCDEEKLQKALELYNISRKDYPKDKTETVLSDFRKSLKNSTKYRCDRFQAYRLFCPEEIATTMVEYKKILDVIQNNFNHKHFAQGINKLNIDSALIDIVIADSFFEGDPLTKEFVLDYFYDIFINRMHDTEFSSLYDPKDAIALVVLKALHFDEYGKNRSEYKIVTDNEYRNFVLDVPYYSKAVEDHPFDKEEYIESFVKGIKESEVFKGMFSSYKWPDAFHITCVDEYFCDAVCHLAWKEIAQKQIWMKSGENISDSERFSDVFDMLCSFFKNPSKED